MDAELKAKWVSALRSGEYKQGQGRLRSGDCYCCLGVLCDLTEMGRWLPPTEDEPSGYDCGDECSYAMLPTLVNDVAGLSWQTQYDLMDLNDMAKKTFDEIADYIEANL